MRTLAAVPVLAFSLLALAAADGLDGGEVSFSYPSLERPIWATVLTEAREGGTRLEIEIGDFTELPHGEDFLEASLEFAERAARKIRELAEGALARP